MPPHIVRAPFACTAGPQRAKLLIVGEAWGESEDMMKKPFVGESGKLLWELLGEAMPGEFPELHAEASRMFRYGAAWTRQREAWLEATGICLTNVLALRPQNNKMESICADKKTVGKDYPYQPSSKGKYLLPEYFGELERLREEIETVRPNLILALGNTASWSVLHATNIGGIRGSIATNTSDAPFNHNSGAGFVIGRKVLATYHPAAVLRQWSWRPIVVADLIKAWREAQFPEIRRPLRGIHINPTLVELEAWFQSFLRAPPKLLSCDIETACGQITCIGFAGSRDSAMVVPIHDRARPGWHYWNPGEELRAWQIIQAVLEHPVAKLGQNFVYDLMYIMKLGIRPRNCHEDTMLLHHSIFPEMQKGLGFLSSVYTNEFAYKLMRRIRPDTEKRDE